MFDDVERFAPEFAGKTHGSDGVEDQDAATAQDADVIVEGVVQGVAKVNFLAQYILCVSLS